MLCPGSTNLGPHEISWPDAIIESMSAEIGGTVPWPDAVPTRTPGLAVEDAPGVVVGPATLTLTLTAERILQPGITPGIILEGDVGSVFGSSLTFPPSISFGEVLQGDNGDFNDHPASSVTVSFQVPEVTGRAGPHHGLPG